MRLLKVDEYYINVDKIIRIYERPLNPVVDKTVTVIEIEGFATGYIGPYDETPYYKQSEILTDKPLEKIIGDIRDMNTLSYLSERSLRDGGLR